MSAPQNLGDLKPPGSNKAGHRYTSCSRNVQKKLAAASSCYGFEALLDKYVALCREAEYKIDVYLVARPMIVAGESTQPYTVGVHVARIDRGRLLPLLGLLSLAHVEQLQPRRHYVVVTDRAALLFVYGKDIYSGSVLELNEDEHCTGLPLVVLNTLYEPLGYGRRLRKHGELLIRNVLDAGWYLRSGV